MRGKAYDLEKVPTNFRITPAYAGKSSTYAILIGQCKDHPRLCGEKIFLCFVIMALIGSPPPMRGKDQAFQPLYMQHRITPAYAGKSVAQAALNVIMRDHPRLCGEKMRTKQLHLTQRGSPPPMRGKVPKIEDGIDFIRITPAYAGKSHPDSAA